MSSTPISSPVPPGSPDYRPVVESSETAAPETLPVAKDTLSQTSPESQTIKIAPVTTKPKLSHPETESISMWDFLTAIGDSKLDFQHVLQRSAMADIMTSNQSSKSLLVQVELVSSLESDLDNAIEEVEIQTAEAVAELESIFDEAQDLVEAQNELTKMLEAGNAEEKEQFAALHDAFKTFKSGVEELKLTDTGNGKDVSIYTIPDDPEISKAI